MFQKWNDEFSVCEIDYFQRQEDGVFIFISKIALKEFGVCPTEESSYEMEINKKVLKIPILRKRKNN